MLKRVILSLFVGIALSSPCISLPFFNSENPVYSTVKSEIIKQASAILGREVSIGSVSGNLVNSVIIKDLKVARHKKLSDGTVISVKEARISYNLFKAAFVKDIVQAIYSIDLVSPDVYVEHEKDGSWNYEKLVAQQDGAAAPAPVFKAKIKISKGKALFVDHLGFGEPIKEKFEVPLSDINGTANFSKKDRIFFKFKAFTKEGPLSVDGKTDFKKASTDVKFSAMGLDVKKWNSYIGIPSVKDIPIEGTADIDLSVSTARGVSLKSDIKFYKGKIYDRPMSGPIKLSLEDDKFTLDLMGADFCKGKIKGSLKIGFNRSAQQVLGRFSFNDMDIADLSGKLPAVRGLADGNVSISGDLRSLWVSAEADISGGVMFGQKINGVSVASRIKDGDVLFDSIRISSGKSEFAAKGGITKNMDFVLESFAQGFEIYNSEVPGGFYGMLDSFEGRLSGKLDENMVKHPLKNIEAQGMLMISNANIGPQKIDLIKGKFILKNAVFESDDFSAFVNRSKISMGGTIGLGDSASFNISGKDLNLSDFKVIESIMPEGAKKVNGLADINISIGGYLPDQADIYEAAKNLSVSLEAKLSEASLAVKDIKTAAVSARWKNKELLIRDLYIDSPGSKLHVTGKTRSDGSMDFSFNGGLSLVDITPFTQSYAKILGRLSFDGRLKGTMTEPDISCAVILEGLNYNNIRLDKLSGRLGYLDGIVSFSGPAVLVQGDDEYSFSVKASLDKDTPYYQGNVYTSKGNLRSLYSIGTSVYEEMIRSIRVTDQGKKVRLRSDSVSFPQLEPYKSKTGDYSLLSINNGFLRTWERSSNGSQHRQESKKSFDIFMEAPLGISADFYGHGSKFTLEASVRSSAGKIDSFGFDSINAGFKVTNNILHLDNFVIKKDGGILSSHGNINMSGPVNIRVDAKDFKIDSINSVFKIGVPIEGRIDMNASVLGTYHDPRVVCELHAEKAGVSDIFLDEVNADIRYSDSVLALKTLEIKTGSQSASIEGVIPFVPGKKLSLAVDLSGENVGLLASLIKGVKWESGTGRAKLDLSGTIDKPKINGVLHFKNATVDINQLRSTAYNFDADILFVDSVLRIKKFSGIISGDRTLNKPLPFSIAGIVDLSRAFSAENMIGFNVLMADTSGSISIPGIYSGDFSLANCSIKGPLILGPVNTSGRDLEIKGGVSLSEGSLTLPTSSVGGASAKNNVKLDLIANIGKNTRLVQGNGPGTISMDLANINLEIYGEDIKISGMMYSPEVKGTVSIKSGVLNVLGREFEVLNEDSQEKIFGADRSMINRNEAVFQGGDAPYSSIPYIRLTAKSEIVNYSQNKSESSGVTDTSPSIKKETVVVVTRVSGMPFVQDKSRSIDLKFYAFDVDTTKKPPEYVAGSYDDNQIRIMLLPDFLKGSLGLSKNSGQTGLDTNAVIVDYLNARIQSYLLRNITSKVEKALGLDSFTLDYNFGKDLEKVLPTKRGEYAVDDRPQFGVGFVKSFFNNVYIQVRYYQSMNEASYLSNTSFNYQITWKATKYYWFVYYREPITFQDQSSTYYKLTLQSQYVF